MNRSATATRVSLHISIPRTYVELEVIPHDRAVLLLAARRVDLEPDALLVRLTEVPNLAGEHTRPHGACGALAEAGLGFGPPETLTGLGQAVTLQLE